MRNAAGSDGAPRPAPDVLIREVEVIFLERLGRDPAASAWLSVQCREMDVLTALKRRLPRVPLNVEDVLTAAQGSPAITCRLAPAEVVDGQLSRHVLHCNPRKLPGVTSFAVQDDFARLAREFNAAGHQPAPGLSTNEVLLRAVQEVGKRSANSGRLTRFEGTLTVRNAGYGSDDAIQVLRVLCPSWLSATVEGRRITLQANPAFNGCYQGPVTVETNAGAATAFVTSRHWSCPPFTEDPVSWRTLSTRHAHLDEEITAQLVEEHLLAAGYRALAGGFFAKASQAAPSRDVTTDASSKSETPSDPGVATCTWIITALHLEEARLPAEGHAQLVRLYSPDGMDRYDVPFDGEALHGEALADLFLMWEVKAGRELHLTPYRGHYQFEVRRPGTWLHMQAVEYRVVSTLQALHRTPLFWDQVEDWLATTPVTMLIQGSEVGLLRDLLQRFPERLDLRTTTQPVGEDRIYFVMGDGSVKTRNLPEGQSLTGGQWPEELWEQCAPDAHSHKAVSQLPPTTQPTDGLMTRPARGDLTPPRATVGALDPYDMWSSAVAHPLQNPDKVLQSIKAILQVEGPMVGHQLYARYSQAAQAIKDRPALSPMQLKKVLNPLLYTAAQRGELMAEDEFGTGGQIGLVYRLPGQPTRPRLKGDRSLDRIPNSELRAVVASLPRNPKTPGQAKSSELEQAVWVLEQFGFGRFIEGGLERVRPLLRERFSASLPAEKSKRRRIS
ncbi:hypothetical protein DEDE109153_04505 [Deinococcus deserti]|uniref:Uncharacterized protein n=1 Tax=Deinococcus deserti (strain DSM 17065 / CIP 109153 / LMG 22923 / VCD115) TaxID=546414 RepID=C1D0X7_DEIDV|nr:hypothetical protein [Deinococcus deserti]ACO45501.1 Hypothetical protein Deide_06511 [Deinococcus deserti VCD115]